MSKRFQIVIRYAPGTIAVICGLGMAVLWMFVLPNILRMIIADRIGFSTSEGLERHGAQLGPWRPATMDDIEGASRLVLPCERYIVREGFIDEFLHHIHLMVVRDKKGEFEDTVIHLTPHWQVGWASFVAVLTSVVPILFGWIWIAAMGRLLQRDE